ncbi:MAG: N-acetyltransferase [Hydrococcus sp. C42_A2020_068]|uniref:GNAT family N-acetyltransferase n=1 Tax=Pleurocapsa sp. PCC 7327 TaxID=118163 RepID=UPI00029FD19D|nr:N-acetyltransferase [Pleurocapsa sp. PCC 7327]AFY75596.1 putative acetyltransferase [Pleurocapsa sp. PCC 7327]MBF2022089.1 N-acetyltransferase [Hydrococcus sp. C42_A2020_068]
MIVVSREIPNHIAAIRSVLETAFDRQAEAKLVDALRSRGVLTMSLVASENDRVVGQIAFSPVAVGAESSSLNAVGLGPLAVLPEYRNREIGLQLVTIGIEECRQAGYDAIFVLGDPAFYSRFGFAPASIYGIELEGDFPQEAFMVRELNQGTFTDRAGVVRYQSEFAEV